MARQGKEVFQATMTFYQSLDFFYSFEIGVKIYAFLINIDIKPHIKLHGSPIKKLGKRAMRNFTSAASVFHLSCNRFRTFTFTPSQIFENV